jgi:hypothetical protein
VARLIRRAAAALTASLALVGAAASAAPLQLSIAPDHLTLGVDAEARVEIRGPEDLEEVSLSANVGALGPVERLGPGQFAAPYRPPARRFPQVALVAALGRSSGGLAVGCAALPLWGQGDALIRTRPGAQVSVTIGAARFGPITADASGVGIIPVVVPPGVRAAYQGARAIDLGVPPAPRLHVVLQRPSVRADRPESLRVFAFAAAADGGLERTIPRLDVSRGALAPLPPPGPGIAAALWTLPAGAAGEALAGAELKGDSGTRVERALRIEPGPPARVEIRADRASYAAGEPDLAVAIEAVDAAGNPVNAAPALRASLGAATAPIRTPKGTFTARVALPGRFSGARELTLVAEAEGGLSAQAKVALAPAPPSTLRLLPARADLLADGRSALALELHLEDRFGNRVEARDLPLVARARRGGARRGDPLARAERDAVPLAHPLEIEAMLFESSGDASAARALSVSPRARSSSTVPSLRRPLASLKAERPGPASSSRTGSRRSRDRTTSPRGLALTGARAAERSGEPRQNATGSTRQHLASPRQILRNQLGRPSTGVPLRVVPDPAAQRPGACRGSRGGSRADTPAGAAIGGVGGERGAGRAAEGGPGRAARAAYPGVARGARVAWADPTTGAAVRGIGGGGHARSGTGAVSCIARNAADRGDAGAGPIGSSGTDIADCAAVVRVGGGGDDGP